MYTEYASAAALRDGRSWSGFTWSVRDSGSTACLTDLCSKCMRQPVLVIHAIPVAGGLWGRVPRSEG